MQTVLDAVATHAAERPEAVAFRDDHGALTWGALVGRVAALARCLGAAPQTVAIGLPGGIDYVVADLALTLTGRRQVPLPFFFSLEQTMHILRETGAMAVITNDPAPYAGLPIEVIAPDQGREFPMPAPRDGAERVIYTSGSSGHPKGVVIGARQLGASLAALSGVVAAGPNDRHLSALPLAQLLEQICGIFLPILAGAETVMRFAATRALLGGPINGLTHAMDEVRPTTSLLAPGLLARWVEALARESARAPESLRFVAVGGAPCAVPLIRAAERAGIPVHEGYGLSECCAVVAMNRPGDNRPGSVGPVLDGLDVKIIEGEITVSGPTVMQGYLGGVPAPARWHTGDLGHFEEGRLVVTGRKDALLITPAGRNISPEWVEARVMADPRVLCAALGLRACDGVLVLVAACAMPVSAVEIAARLEDLPDYARPAAVILIDPKEPGLIFPAGTPNRAVAAQLIDMRAALPLQYFTTTERRAS